ncbi:MAG: helix-turn-helix transcriptional regulator [Chitinophagaceae bacterium]|nr:helix-turn-helix transcriptional regulator [Chitinophagaceae bacterium]
MILQFHIPPFPLNNYIELVTYYKGYNPPHTIERLLPDGGIDLIIDLTSSPKHIYDNDSLQEIQVCKNAWISGMRTEYISIQARADESEMMVIRFRPGTAWSFLHMPVLEIKDKVVDAELIFGKELLSFREALLEALTPGLKFAIAENYLLKRIKNHFEIHPAVSYCITRINGNPSQTSIKDITHKTGYTNKHLISLFGKYAGIGPKQYIKVLKFQQAVLSLEKDPGHISWSSLALDCGYYDQAHFINEFKRFSGFNPSAYMEVKGDYVNYIPVR